MADIGVLLFSTPSFTVSGSVLSRLGKQGTQVVFCGEDFLPIGQLLATAHATDSYNRLALQVSASKPLRKNLWRDLVQAKIKSQAAVLQECGKAPGAITHFIKKVSSGDDTNVEAQAARVYWGELFGKAFRRRQNQADVTNILLNYGYTVLRAFAARAIISSGLNPLISVHHSAKQNPLALADDLMEPFRPLIDLRVKTLIDNNTKEIDSVAKIALVDTFTMDILRDGETTTIPNLLLTFCREYLRSLESKTVELGPPGFFKP